MSDEQNKLPVALTEERINEILKTIPTSDVSFGEINLEIERGSTTESNLSMLNEFILPELRPASPSVGAFRGLNYYQNNTKGNCNNGNCPDNCNCGNKNCADCVIIGTVNCANCDSQKWLQTGTNCACTYNCEKGSVTINCDCACNCSKIICAKLYEFGLMPNSIWTADQAYGRWLHKNDKRVYLGYIRWARIVTAWMDGKDPSFMPWIKDDELRRTKQKDAITKMALRIGTPWSEHMAYLMGTLKEDNLKGRVLMEIGKPICRLISYVPRKPKHKRKHKLITLYVMWSLFYISDWSANTVVYFANLFRRTKNQILKGA